MFLSPPPSFPASFSPGLSPFYLHCLLFLKSQPLPWAPALVLSLSHSRIGKLCVLDGPRGMTELVGKAKKAESRAGLHAVLRFQHLQQNSQV